MCEGIDCGSGGNCINGNCSCETGYVDLQNFCEEIFQECQTGFVKIENDCEETCALDPCKALVRICPKISCRTSPNNKVLEKDLKMNFIKCLISSLWAVWTVFFEIIFNDRNKVFS